MELNLLDLLLLSALGVGGFYLVYRLFIGWRTTLTSSDQSAERDL